MYILGIDTSCDDTCVAIVEADKRRYQRGLTRKSFEILSNIVSSQVKLHQRYGGVWPYLAKREHQRNLAPVFKKALEEARLLNSKFKNQKSKIDAIGVTVGPGLEPCLWQGVNFAKVLSHTWKKPIIPINHIEAHILANWLTPIRQCQMSNVKSQKLFPAVCLVVSGGHTQLILMKDIGKYKLIGETRDDAAGECFDKTARILGLGYPGGPAIAKIAKKSDRAPSSVRLPRPMIYQKNYDFSFAGLKTAVLYDFKSRPLDIRKSKEYIRAMAREIQQAVIDVLIHKTLRAARDFGVKSIILGGGVVANEELRKQFKSKVKSQKHAPYPPPSNRGRGGAGLKVNFFVPEKKFCTDNGAMIALTAFFHRKEATRNLKKIKANANLKI